MAKEITVTKGVAVTAPAAKADAVDPKTLPWRCAPCWKLGKDVQLEEGPATKNIGDPTGKLACPDGHSWWGKTGLDDE